MTCIGEGTGGNLVDRGGVVSIFLSVLAMLGGRGALKSTKNEQNRKMGTLQPTTRECTKLLLMRRNTFNFFRTKSGSNCSIGTTKFTPLFEVKYG